MNKTRRALVISLLGFVAVGPSVVFSAPKTSGQFRLWSPYDTYNTLFITNWDSNSPPGLGHFTAEIKGGEIWRPNSAYPSGSSGHTRGVAETTIATYYNGSYGDSCVYDIQILAVDSKDISGWSKSGDVRYAVSRAGAPESWFYPGNLNT